MDIKQRHGNRSFENVFLKRDELGTLPLGNNIHAMSSVISTRCLELVTLKISSCETTKEQLI
jgi:hypothetical protein